MYVLVHHDIHDPHRFFAVAEEATPNLPPELTLHHTIPARDGSFATCLWEAESVEAVRSFLEPVLGDISSNRYSEAENREGIAMASQIPE